MSSIVENKNAVYVYDQDTELPGIPFHWLDNEDQVIPFAAGWTFKCYICTYQTVDTVAMLDNSGFEGADTLPNLVANWNLNQFAALVGSATGIPYSAKLRATRTSDGKRRKLDFTLWVRSKPTELV